MELLGLFVREYSYNDYIGGETPMISPSGADLLREIQLRRGRIGRFRQPEVEVQAMAQRQQRDELYQVQLVRTYGRSGVSVLNKWIREREDLMAEFSDFSVDQSEILDAQSQSRDELEQRYSSHDDSALVFIENFYESPAPPVECRVLKSDPFAAYLLYSLEDVLNCKVRMNDTLSGVTHCLRVGRRGGKRVRWKDTFEIL